MAKDPNAPWFLPLIHYPLSLSGPRTPPKCAQKPDQCKYMRSYWINWYQADYVYGHPTVYFLATAIAIFTIFHIASRFTPQSIKEKPVWRRTISLCRFVAYKSFQVPGTRLVTPPIGAIFLIATGIIYFFSMVLAPGGYYYPFGGPNTNLPPLSARTSWMMLACLPFVMVLGVKASPVKFVTGISHEKLNAWHGWIGWVIFVLSMVHAFPSIVFRARNGQLFATFTKDGVYLTGIISICSLAVLTILSTRWVRARFYEAFKASHMFFVIVFLVFVTCHATFALSAWNFLIASMVIYTCCLLYAVFRTLFYHGITRTARIRLETPHTLRISIPSNSKWRPGQHMYLRFLTSLGLNALSSHPFSICTLPSAENGEMVFFVRPRGGITKRLATLASKSPDRTLPVLLDGPYGGFSSRWSEGFDKTIIIAGGSGAGFTLGVIQDWLRNAAGSARQLAVVIATRDAEMREWYMVELHRILQEQGVSSLADIPGVSVSIHETTVASSIKAVRSPLAPELVSDVEKKLAVEEPTSPSSENTSSISSSGITYSSTRPDLYALVSEYAAQAQATVGVVVCGPTTMIHDVSDATADIQRKIIAGDPKTASELWMHSEPFSY